MDNGATSATVLVVPCSGIGKVQGLLSREATFTVVDELAGGAADTLCLALLVKGDPDAVAQVREHGCITIDGCGKACARKNVEMAGGEVAKALQVGSVLKNHRGAQPGTGAVLTMDGWPVAQEIAEIVARDVARLCAGEEVAP